jgi:hypothetical protein
VFRIYHPLTLNGYSNFINAVKRQRNLGLQVSMLDLQYSQTHSVINHCDRGITFLSDTDTSFGLFNPFTYSDIGKNLLSSIYITL